MLANVLFLMFWPTALSQKMSDAIKADLLTPLREYGETCGYESCPLTKPGSLNVHIVPHTHLELGAYLTFDQHWTGDDDRHLNTKQTTVKRILDFVLTELWKNPSRRFTLADTAYLFYWWSKRDATVHRMVYELIRQGRLLLVGGGFSMSDEASVSYQAVIDHFTFSLRKINNTFASCGRPLVAWQADAYGHSREFASLMAQMGFDGLFINPISYDDEVARMRRKALEIVWRGSDELGAETDIYTHKLFDGYWSPPGFCFGLLCTDPLLVTNDNVFLNIHERVDRFLESVQFRQSQHYTTRNVMIMMGHRDAYFDAKTWFDNIEKLMHFVNKKNAEKNLNVSIFYSSPMCYINSVHSENPVLETKQDDFFPLVYNNDTYVVGMYTSRPTLKYIVREGFVFLQIAKQLQVTANLPDNRNFFEEFMWIMSVIQDHSVITGAIRTVVNNYYVQKMYAAITKSTRLISAALQKLRMSITHVKYNRCMLNISSCIGSCYEKFSIQVYNPLGWFVTSPVRLSTVLVSDTENYKVYGPDGMELKSVMMELPEPIKRIKRRPAQTTHEIVFIAKDIPPLGFRSYFIESTAPRQKRAIIKQKIIPTPKKYFIRQTIPINMDQDKFVPDLDNEFDEDLNLNYTAVSSNFTEDDGKIDYEIDVSEENVSETPTTVPPTTTEMLDILAKLYDRSTIDTTTKDTTITETTTKRAAPTRTTTSPTTTKVKTTTTETPKTETTTTLTTKTPNRTKSTVKPPSVKKEDQPPIARQSSFNVTEDSGHFIGNKYVRVYLDSDMRVASINLCNGVTMKLGILLYYYVSDDPVKLARRTVKSPGAWVFRPMDPQPIIMFEDFNAKIIKTDLVEEILMSYNSWSFVNIRLYIDDPVVEVRWLVGPVPIEDELGKDIFIKYITDLSNLGEFYTDSNGRQTIKRVRSARATYEPIDIDLLSGNLYPVTSKIYIEDLKKNVRFSVFNDRSQAGGSIEDGQIDLMIHRRLLTGTLGILNETEHDEGIRVLGSHYLYVTKADYKKNRIFEKKFAKEVEMAPKVLVSDGGHFNNSGTVMRQEFLNNRNEFSALAKQLPIGVHLMTLEIWTDGILIRLENYLEKADVLKTGRKVIFLKGLFVNFDIISIKETTLGANMWKNEWFPTQWEKRQKFYTNFNDFYNNPGNISYDMGDEVFYEEASLENGIGLYPQQIRTFVAKYRYIS